MMMTTTTTTTVTSGAQSDLTSAEAVEAIVTAKHKERLEELEGIKLQVAAEHDEKLRRAAEEHRVLHEGNQRRKARQRDTVSLCGWPSDRHATPFSIC